MPRKVRACSQCPCPACDVSFIPPAAAAICTWLLLLCPYRRFLHTTPQTHFPHALGHVHRDRAHDPCTRVLLDLSTSPLSAAVCSIHSRVRGVQSRAIQLTALREHHRHGTDTGHRTTSSYKEDYDAVARVRCMHMYLFKRHVHDPSDANK